MCPPSRSRAATYTSGDQLTAASTLPALKTLAASTAEEVKTQFTSRLVSPPWVRTYSAKKCDGVASAQARRLPLRSATDLMEASTAMASPPRLQSYCMIAFGLSLLSPPYSSA